MFLETEFKEFWEKNWGRSILLFLLLLIVSIIWNFLTLLFSFGPGYSGFTIAIFPFMLYLIFTSLFLFTSKIQEKSPLSKVQLYPIFSATILVCSGIISFGEIILILGDGGVTLLISFIFLVVSSLGLFISTLIHFKDKLFRSKIENK
ncbi:MAG: hypothetical protein ACTSQF_14560 [Candidatus Heimdallarchaeaceae archaeon]